MRLAHVMWAAAVASACTSSGGAQSPAMGKPAPPPLTGPMVPALEGKLNVPPGFKVATFGTVKGARFMALGPDGAVYVSVPRESTVVRLIDRNNDGVSDTSAVVVSGLSRPHGLAFHGGYLYIANTDGVVRVRLDGEGKAAGTPEKLNSYSGGGGHWSRSIVFGADSAMYVSIGSTCNLCEEKTEDRAAVMRFDADGKNGRVFSKGLRNAVGIAVHPQTKQIWVTQNERDNLPPNHEDLPPEEINILQDGGDYGWPYCYGDRVPTPDDGFNHPERCGATIPPALAMQAHSAPLGMTFLDKATNFPEDYRGDALVAFHGSWNRDTPTGAKLARIHIKDGKPVSYEDFMTGFQGSDGKRWARPVDVMVYKDGSILVSDDAAGNILRVYR
jgi:glucose/arabinose dehydrogenase